MNTFRATSERAYDQLVSRLSALPCCGRLPVEDRMDLAAWVEQQMHWAREQGSHEGHQQATYHGLTLAPKGWYHPSPIPDSARRYWDGQR